MFIAAIFAFLLDPAVVLVSKLRIPRAAATAIVIGLAIVAFYFLVAVAWGQVSAIADELPSYGSRVNEVVGALNNKIDDIEKKTVDLVIPKNLRQQEQQIQQKPQDALKARRQRGVSSRVVPSPPVIQEVHIHTDPRPVLGTVYGYVANYLNVLVMASFVPFLVYFMLSWRDHLYRGFLQLFPVEEQSVVGQSWSHIGDATRAFVLGNFILWLLLSVVSGASFFFLGLPYWPIVGLLSAFLSLVPYVGLALSVVPPLLAVLVVPNAFKIVLTTVAVTAALHLAAMNFVYPKIVGKRVRLNPLVVTIAMMFWGLIWGGMGLLLAVPITAGIKAVCDNFDALRPYGKLLGD